MVERWIQSTELQKQGALTLAAQVQTSIDRVTMRMKWLQGTWVLRFNRFGGENVRPFQGRYKALHVGAL